MPLKIAILASGSGTNAQAMIDKSADGILDVDIRMILSNRPGAGVLERARKAGLPHLALDHTLFPDRESYDRKLIAVLQESGAELIVLAGYMRLLSSTGSTSRALAARGSSMRVPASLPPSRASRPSTTPSAT